MKSLDTQEDCPKCGNEPSNDHNLQWILSYQTPIVDYLQTLSGVKEIMRREEGVNMRCGCCGYTSSRACFDTRR
jgi:predicted nucleic-acid-binding Zn-ribbon protein